MSDSPEIIDTPKISKNIKSNEELKKGDLVPNTPNQLAGPPEPECIIEDEKLVGIYDEILDNCREDRDSIDEMLNKFIDMIINEGDSSNSSKETLVNLFKIKSDTADKMSKVADLMTRLKLKDKDTFPRYLAVQQNTKIVNGSSGSQRELLKKINKVISENKKENE